MSKNLFNDFRKFYKSRNKFKMTEFDDMFRKMSETQGYMNPYIMVERENMNLSQLDIFSRLMVDRIIFFNSEVTSESCGITMAQLLYLDSEDKKDIKLYINSPGGSVNDGLGIVSIMDFIESDVCTVNLALAASMGSVLLAAGTKGKRSALKYSRTLLHQPMSGIASGTQELDIAIHAKEMAKIKKTLYDFFVERTSQPYEIIEKTCDRDSWFDAQEAKDFGIIDTIINK